MTQPRFDPADVPDFPKGDKPDPAASYIDVGEDDPEQDFPVDPLTGKRAEPEAPEEARVEQPKSTRPPWWLVGFTLLIPVAVFFVWYMNWMGRPLSVGTINEYLTSSNDKDVAHALVQIAKQSQDASEEAAGAQRRIDARYKDAREAIKRDKSGQVQQDALKQLDDDYRTSLKNIEAEYRRIYDDLELTFDGVLNFVRNSKSRPAPLIEAACGALSAMNKSDRYREKARSELRNLLRHENKVVRRAAACNLANFADDQGRDIILEMLDDPDANARANAAIALSRVGRQSDGERLKKLSESDPDPKVREFAYQGYSALSGKVD
ncbi:MAG: HEAT repeat domain-containing protein [Planctomycetes bacterium]|nr:HEAT repeat domain-containing protein [Planctomycetota bacterium]